MKPKIRREIREQNMFMNLALSHWVRFCPLTHTCALSHADHVAKAFHRLSAVGSSDMIASSSSKVSSGHTTCSIIPGSSLRMRSRARRPNKDHLSTSWFRCATLPRTGSWNVVFARGSPRLERAVACAPTVLNVYVREACTLPDAAVEVGDSALSGQQVLRS